MDKEGIFIPSPSQLTVTLEVRSCTAIHGLTHTLNKLALSLPLCKGAAGASEPAFVPH
jgi:hypothetical protein